MARETARAWLFDLFAKGPEMVLWLLAEDGRRLRLADRSFAMTVFAEGPAPEVEACLRALEASGVAAPLGPRLRRDFWTGRLRPVQALRPADLQGWGRSLRRAADRFPLVEWHNADLAPEQVYCYERDAFPFALCEVEFDGGELLALRCLDDRWAADYPSPPFETVALSAEGSLLGRIPRLESITLRHGGSSTTWDDPPTMLEAFQGALRRIDPDVVMTAGGDSFVFPLLLSVAERQGVELDLDREPPPEPRRVEVEGRSYMSYGRVLYSSPDFHLYGRLHLDACNSFMVEKSGLEGLFEVARLSRIPPQRIGRRSIGTGITSVQIDLAWRDGYLVPWRKTRPEAWKSAAQLLRTDRGGLVYAPQPGFHDEVVELDFASMYPTIMARFNVSPETVNCGCCANARVPEIGYGLCEKRRGLVSRALEPIIAKREEYKRLRAEAKAAGDLDAHRRADHRQSALKWMLVCCFGYLGYRNARFGRIEAHEAVSAFSRELLTVAREACEERGWRMLMANVDCVFIAKPGWTREEVDDLCRGIDARTGLSIALEGVYRWIAFLPSRQVPGRPVPTRYFGCFEDGSLKYRGIECRRSDLPPWVRERQLEAIRMLAEGARGTEECRAMAPALLERAAEWEAMLWRHEVPLDALAIRGSLSKDPGEYAGPGRQALAARQAVQAGLGLHAGQAIEYLVTNAGDPDRERRVRLAALADADTTCDPAAYVRMLRRAMNTVLWPLGAELDERRIDPPWAPAKPAKGRRNPDEGGPRQLDFLAGA